MLQVAPCKNPPLACSRKTQWQGITDTRVQAPNTQLLYAYASKLACATRPLEKGGMWVESSRCAALRLAFIASASSLDESSNTNTP